MPRLLAVVLALVTSALVLSAPSSQARAAAPSSLTTTYRCGEGSQSGSSPVTIAGTIPRSVRKGVAIPARKVGAAVTVPASMVAIMRQYGVTSVKGTATGAKVRIGQRTVPVRDLRLPRTAVPASGDMVLKGVGTMAAFTPAKAGTFAIRVPQSFTANVTAHSTTYGDVPASFGCALKRGAPSRFGTLTVSG